MDGIGEFLHQGLAFSVMLNSVSGNINSEHLIVFNSFGSHHHPMKQGCCD